MSGALKQLVKLASILSLLQLMQNRFLMFPQMNVEAASGSRHHQYMDGKVLRVLVYHVNYLSLRTIYYQQ